MTGHPPDSDGLTPEFPGQDHRLPGELLRVTVIDIPSESVLSAHALLAPVTAGRPDLLRALVAQLRSLADQLELGAY